NQSASIAPVDVGNEIADLVQIAKEVSRASQGCYDLTIKPLFDLWGFSGESVSLPGSAELEQVRKLTGFGLVSVPTLTELQKNAPEAEIDLSSIAQGYSVDRVASVIEAAGIKNYLVEIGGELKTRGHKPDGSFWRIAIERPLPGGRAVQKVLTIGQDEPVSVMTSGTYRHYFDDHGTRYSHVLDARTGKPITHKTVSVTVLDQDPTLADAWSTALLCLGDEEGLTIANQAGIAALFLRESGEQFVEKTTSAWRSMKNIEVQ
ncbi:MAG: FAD:protein FMN transferase, partial [Pseudomonas sp.]|nr:FAD:protein FMN transferase [Pseudomonas sp.]